MSTSNNEYVNPNEPFRFLRTFGRDLGPDLTYPDYLSVSTEGLLDLAFALLDDPDTGPIFNRAGIHGDIGAEDEAVISDFVEAFVEQQHWEKPDPANLVISTVLARQMADGGLSRQDQHALIEFIEDKRCDGLGQYKRNSPRTHKPLRASEVVSILQWLDKQEELKAPYTPLRSKTFRRGQSFFEDEDTGRSFFLRLVGTAGQVAVSKYGLTNRNLDLFSRIIGAATEYYATKKIDSFDDSKLLLKFTDEYIIKISR